MCPHVLIADFYGGSAIVKQFPGEQDIHSGRGAVRQAKADTKTGIENQGGRETFTPFHLRTLLSGERKDCMLNSEYRILARR